MENIEDRFNEIESKIIEQEHRLLPIIRNIIDHGFDRSSDKFKASWFPLLSYIFKRQAVLTVVALSSGITALLGCYLAYNSNAIVSEQNELIREQNTKVDQQNYLIEAERRSNLVFLFSNIMDKLDQELKDDYLDNNIRDISPQLIGRISSLTQRLTPYRKFHNSRLDDVEESPERGQLFINILEADLSQINLNQIMSKSNFDNIVIKDYDFPSEIFLDGIDLDNGVFENSYPRKIRNSKLKFCRFKQWEINMKLYNSRFINSYVESTNGFNLRSDLGVFKNSRIKVNAESERMNPTFIDFNGVKIDTFTINGSKGKYTIFDSKVNRLVLDGDIYDCRLVSSVFTNSEFKSDDFGYFELSNSLVDELSVFSTIDNYNNIKIPFGDSLMQYHGFGADVVDENTYYLIPNSMKVDSFQSAIHPKYIVNALITFNNDLSNYDKILEYSRLNYPIEIINLIKEIVSGKIPKSLDYVLQFNLVGDPVSSTTKYEIESVLDSVKYKHNDVYIELVKDHFYRTIDYQIVRETPIQDHVNYSKYINNFFNYHSVSVDSNYIYRNSSIYSQSYEYVSSVDSIYFPNVKNRNIGITFYVPIKYYDVPTKINFK